MLTTGLTSGLASGLTTDIQTMSGQNYQPIAEDAASAATTSVAVTVATATTTSATTTKSVVKKTNLNKDVESRVRDYFSDLPIMAEIAKCESRYRQFNADGTVFRGVVNSKDLGVMQVNDYYHGKRATKLNVDLRTLDGNMSYARLLYTEEGTQPWVASRPCWIKSDVAKAMFSTGAKLAEK